MWSTIFLKVWPLKLPSGVLDVAPMEQEASLYQVQPGLAEVKQEASIRLILCRSCVGTSMAWNVVADKATITVDMAMALIGHKEYQPHSALEFALQ
jgi:hypothetical protein